MRWPYYVLVAALVAVDQGVKAAGRAMPLGEQTSLIPSMLWFTHVQNTGATFGIFQGNNALFIWLTIFFIGLLLWFAGEFETRGERTFYALLFVGLIGNLIDRIFLGHVTDVFDLGWWPVFNVADASLVVGVTGLLFLELWSMRKAKTTA